MKKAFIKRFMKPLIIFNIIISIGLHSVPVISQNFVPNWSFEDHISCPTWWNQIERINGWYKAHENIGTDTSYSSDYCNSCGSYNFSVPNNIWGYQFASTGSAYVAIATMSPTIFTNYRENIYAKLISPLSPGVKYSVSLKISKTNKSQFSTNNIGIKFSTTTSFPINNSAHVNSTNVITDTLGWFELQSIYTPDSAYEYIAVGNFFVDANTLIIQSCPTCAYPLYGYYIDDVCVIPEEGDCLVPTSVTNIYTDSIKSSFFPNPFNDFTQLKLNRILGKGSLIIYDHIGKKVRIIDNITSDVLIKKENLKSGIYHFILLDDNKTIDKGNIIITD